MKIECKFNDLRGMVKLNKLAAVKVQGMRFVDGTGREVLLHGVNMVCKDKKSHYIGNWDERDFKKLKSWGMNVIRLGVIWDGLEPEPNVYNDDYIEKLRHFIRLAEQQDIWVFLDMHQDLFSSAFGDGAPLWATITDGELYEAGATWSDAYLFNGAVQNAFDHFWRNTPGPVGKGIQDHFIDAWKYLVQKLHIEPNVIGYDLLNEPFIGREATDVMDKMMNQYAEIYQSQNGDIEQEEIFAAFLDPNRKEDYFHLLEDAAIFQQVIDAPSPILHKFEQTILSPFFQRVTDAIRTIDDKRILFLETNYFANLGVSIMIQPLLDHAGNKESQQVYAPHAYDLVVDTELAHTANDRRLDLIFERHEQTKQRLGIPMMFGEWGAFYNTNNTAHISLHIKRLMERLLCSDTYWDYTPDMDQYLPFLGVRRAYPMAVSGNLYQYRHEEGIGSFQMRWKESLNESTIIYFPNIQEVEQANVVLSPAGSNYRIHRIEDSSAGYLEIPEAVKGVRSLVITKD